MRVVVFSDSHGNFNVLHNVVLAQPGAGMFLFLGDGLREFEDIACLYPDKEMRGVRGNCDWASDAKVYDQVFCEGKKILLTHGHLSGVKRDIQPLVDQALVQKADILLYGHTHVAVSTYTGGLHLLNPGSVSQPRGGRASYGIVDITPAGIVTNIVPL